MNRSARWAILFVVLFVASAAAVALFALWSLSGAGPWRGDSVLWVKLDGATPEVSAHDPLTRLLGREVPDLRDTLDGLERAGTDHRIKGLLVEVVNPELGAAQNEELRAAIARFRASGKWAWAFVETAGEFSSGNGAYLLASSCDKVLLSPPGDLGLTGLRAETPFLRGLFDKLGVSPQMGQRKEFKNAANTYTDKDYTPAHREATLRLVESIYADMIDGIAKGRKTPSARVRELISAGPYTGPEAKALGLIDDLVYRDEVMRRVEQDVGRDKPLISLAEYVRQGRPHDSGWRKIAVVYATGLVSRGRSGRDLLMGDTMGSDTICQALRTAREDSAVAAVVLRVDSPGGSYVASDVVRREVELTRKVKPVVVSMGNVAASGGYFISMDAGRILADSATITGSIGVFGGKMVTREFWEEKVGIHFGGLETDDNADFWSTQSEFSSKGWARLNAWLDRIYEDFTTKAAHGRGMKVDELEPLAHGRVWSGKDALARKLVDRIGGLYEAVDVAREQGGIGADTAFQILVLPRPVGLVQSLLGRDDTSALPVEARQALRALALLTPQSEERLLFDPGVPLIR